MKISNITSAALSLIRLLLSLFVLWLTLGWKVRQAKKAFEKELIQQGMAKEDAEKLSAQYSKLKDDIMNTLKRSFIRNI